MVIPKSFKTVTPFTKSIALVLYFVLMGAGFWLGVAYGEAKQPATKAAVIYKSGATSQTKPVTTPIVTVPTEDELITKAACADAAADVNVDLGSISCTVSAKQDNFARVSVNLNPSGYAAILKKVDNIWLVVAKGQEAPSQADGLKYGLPAGWYSTDY